MKKYLSGLFVGLMSFGVYAETLAPPFEETFDDRGSYSRFTIIDANKDNNTFEITDGSARLRFPENGLNDDWLVLPALQLNGGTGYTLKFDAYCHHVRYPEYFEVKVASEPTATALSRGTAIVDRTVINNLVDDPYKCEVLYTPPTDGVYYIGIHGYSGASSFYLYVGNISLSDGILKTSPGAVTDASVTPGANGQLSATIKYTAPKSDFAGNPLTQLDGVKIYRDDTLIETQHPSVGEAMSYVDGNVTAGEHVYSMIPYNSEGDGEVVKISAFVGFNRPSAVTGFKSVAGEHAGQAALSWEPVVTDISGLTYPEGSVTYKVMRVYGYDQLVVAEGLTQTSYVDNYCEPDAAQVGVYYTVVPVSAAGEGLPTNGQYLPLGKAYEIPFAETFADGDVAYGVWVSDGPGQWSIKGDYDIEYFASQDHDDGMVCLIGDVDAPSDFISGRISLVDLPGATLSFHTIAFTLEDTPYMNAVEVLVDCGDGEGFSQAAYFDENDAVKGVAKWIERKVDLTPWIGKEIRFALRFHTISHPVSAFDNIKIEGRWAHDMAIGEYEYPARLSPGIGAVIPVSVINRGSEKASGYNVVLYRNDEVALTVEGPALQPDESDIVELNQMPSSMWGDGVTYRIEVDYDLEERPTDNVGESVEVAIRVNNFPVPAKLTGSGSPLALSWLAPVLETASAIEVHDDISSLTPFSTGMPGSALGRNDNIGDWSVIDVDGMPSMKVGIDFPNAGSKMAFIVFDDAAVDLDWEVLNDHGGDGAMFMSLSVVSARNDDWLVSPQLSGEAQTISFYARSLMLEMPEMYEVYYSTTGKEHSDFKIIRQAANAGDDWQKIEVELPQGANYFAIRYISLDHYGLCLDDFTYTPLPANSGLELRGYNVYKNGVAINEDLISETELNNVYAVDGDRFNVTAMYNKGESAPGNTYGIGSASVADVLSDSKITIATGSLTVETSAGTSIIVADFSGIVRYSFQSTGCDTIKLARGFYIVSVDGKSTKVSIP